MSTPVSDRAEIANVGRIAANDDAEIGDMIAQAMDKVGKDGVITVEEGRGIETDVEWVEGMQFDRGYLSPYFVTDTGSMEVVMENPLILLHEKKLSSAQDLVPLLEQIARAGKPLLFIAEDIDGEALATLVVNKLRGILNCAAVKAPGFGDRRNAMLEDIATLTGGRAIFEALGIELKSLQLSDLGTARRVVIDKDNTTIIEGAGAASAIKGRIEQIRREIDSTTSDYDREKLEERLAKLAGGVAQINVGAATEIEMKEKKARVEDALHATRSAVAEGILPGGGVALVRARRALGRLKLTGDEKAGVDILDRALTAPLRQIAENAGLEGAVVLQKVLDSDDAVGFDAAAGKYVDMMKAGIIDPTKVVVNALANAASIAVLLLTTEAVVTEIPDDKPPAPSPGGGDMY